MSEYNTNVDFTRLNSKSHEELQADIQWEYDLEQLMGSVAYDEE